MRSKVKSGRNPIKNLSKLVAEFKDRGLQGIEVHYGDYTDDQINKLSVIAEENDLIECGGSDFHNSGNPGEPQPGTIGPPMENFHKLKDRLQ
jgi:predicted metal-dependent phosphoesterase TrpH